LLFESISWIEP